MEGDVVIQASGSGGEVFDPYHPWHPLQSSFIVLYISLLGPKVVVARVWWRVIERG
jgi:hypothetical protein